jgi:archaellum component FlaC
MTIDERLERLTERHEALTQTVELMAAESRAMAAENQAGFERLRKVENILGQVARSLDTLARVVELHEHRIDTLEGGAS